MFSLRSQVAPYRTIGFNLSLEDSRLGDEPRRTSTQNPRNRGRDSESSDCRFASHRVFHGDRHHDDPTIPGSTFIRPNTETDDEPTTSNRPDRTLAID